MTTQSRDRQRNSETGPTIDTRPPGNLHATEHGHLRARRQSRHVRTATGVHRCVYGAQSGVGLPLLPVDEAPVTRDLELRPSTLDAHVALLDGEHAQPDQGAAQIRASNEARRGPDLGAWIRRCRIAILLARLECIAAMAGENVTSGRAPQRRGLCDDRALRFCRRWRNPPRSVAPAPAHHDQNHHKSRHLPSLRRHPAQTQTSSGGAL